MLSKEIRQKKTGEPYLSLHLADRTGEMEAKMWDNVAEVMDAFDRDDFVKVKGLLQLYQNRSQFTVHRLRRLEDHEVDFADFFPCSERDPDEMFAELQGIIAGIENPHLRASSRRFSATRTCARYKIAPAAKNIHHACRGGLIEHVLSLCSSAGSMAPHYKNVDLDLLLTGAILHDIGKVEELPTRAVSATARKGNCLGISSSGFGWSADKFEQLPDFPPKLRTLVEHMIISHHGELEFGSPKVPLFPEALLLHHLDNLDSKMEAMKNALQARSQRGEFTGWINSLERSVLRKDRYLDESSVARRTSRCFRPPSSATAVATSPVPACQSACESAPKKRRRAAQPVCAARFPALPPQSPANRIRSIRPTDRRQPASPNARNTAAAPDAFRRKAASLFCKRQRSRCPRMLGL